MLVVAIASQKGGVGKTTVAVNLGVELYRQGVKVAVVDMDAQGSATYALGLVPDEQAGFERWLAGEEVLLTHTPVPLIPGGLDTAYIQWQSPGILSSAITRLDTDLVLLDCPPSLVTSTVAALVAANRVLVPVLADPLVLMGLAQILDTLNDVNPQAQVDVLRSKYKPQLKMTSEADEILVADSRFNLLRICIPENVAIAESAGHGKPVKDYASASKGAKAFKAISAEVIKEWGLNHGN
ncbi:MAG: ParA family protein [Snowella sp.]|nr:ParA family protein [Snowella sp.]